MWSVLSRRTTCSASLVCCVTRSWTPAHWRRKTATFSVKVFDCTHADRIAFFMSTTYAQVVPNHSNERVIKIPSYFTDFAKVNWDIQNYAFVRDWAILQIIFNECLANDIHSHQWTRLLAEVFLALNPDLIVYLFDTAAASVFEIYDHLVKPISFCADVTNSDS